MPVWLTVLLSVLGVILVLFIVLMIVGSKLQKKANAQQETMEAAAQTVSMLIIDKKKLKITEANLPKVVTDQVPKYARRAKFPIVKARVVGAGSKPMNLIADAKVFELLPVGKECKVSVSGIYITEIKSVRGGSIPTLPKKKGLFKRKSKKTDNTKDKNAKTDKKDKTNDTSSNSKKK